LLHTKIPQEKLTVAESVASGEIGLGIGEVGRHGLEGLFDEQDSCRGGSRFSLKLFRFSWESGPEKFNGLEGRSNEIFDVNPLRGALEAKNCCSRLSI
jgi:hypothetical protein